MFLAAAFAAGFVEGVSVLSFHRRRTSALLSSTIDDSSNDNNFAAQNRNDNTVAILPSVSMFAAHTMLYGIVSIPLGIVGASPGIAFLPHTITSRYSHDNKVVVSPEENDNCESGQRTVKENGQLDLYPSPPITTTPDIHGNRNLGWVLRQENSKKISMHNKWTRPSFSDLESSSSSMPNLKLGVNTTTARTSMLHPTTATRYIATLDGVPLPTVLAESMRRARCLFIGAGIISYAITEYYLGDQQQQQEIAERYNSASDARRGRCSVEFGYDQWINTKSVNIWNERIRNGKSVDDYGELFQKSQSYGMSHRRGFVLPNLNLLPNYNTTNVLETLFGGVYKEIMQLVKFQLEKDSDNASDVTNAIINGQDGVLSVEEDMQSATTPLGELQSTVEESTMFELQPPQRQGKNSPSVSWSVIVTTVDVLGTSIRHLFESTYRIVTSAASFGRRASRGTSGSDNEQTTS